MALSANLATGSAMRITKTFEFSMGHALHAYVGKCHDLHGHNYVLEITVESDELDGRGMVMDFGELKNIWRHIEPEYDHKTLLHEADSRFPEGLPGVRRVQWEPTAENLAIVIADRVAAALTVAKLTGIKLWETSTSYAEMIV